MKGRLFTRNVVTLVLTVLAGQMVAAVLVFLLVMEPQARRLAQMTADMTDIVGMQMARMSGPEREALVRRLNAGQAVAIRPGTDAPGGGLRRPTIIEREFLAAMADRFNHGAPLEWTTDRQSRLWVRLWLGGPGVVGQDWWVSLTPPGMRAPFTGMVIAGVTALVVSLLGGIMLQRHLDRPLRRLAAGVDALDPDALIREEPDGGPRLAEDGPAEIAAVARAFNRMAARLAAHEAERALMLGAVSHDLRTPLTRLRLSLELLHDSDADLLVRARGQVDRIEAMLAQFLDMARSMSAEQPCPTDVVALLVHAAFDAGFDTERAGELDLVVPERLEAMLRPGASARAIANLLGNALRHGTGPYRLAARVEGRELVIEVADSGAGFGPEMAEALCRPFARGDAARGGDGAGLGLAIAARVAALHGGRLDFVHAGAMFCARLRLPLVPPRQA